jgi:hypothetical protein
MAGESHSTPLPLCPKKQEGWLPGVSFPGSKPRPPCRTVTTDPGLELQGAHYQAGLGGSPYQLAAHQKGRPESAANVPVGSH